MKGFFPSAMLHKERTEVGLVTKCGACQLLRKCQSPKMSPYGSGKQGVLIVGEAPGQTEDEMGRPFVGKAGQHLRRVLRSIGIDMDRDAWTTNALICRPPKNATPTPEQISYCRPALLETIDTYRPKIIITLGRSALASAIQPYWKGEIGPLERWIGWRIPIRQHWICPTYHPSYLLRMKNSLMDRLFADQLEAAFHIEDDVVPSYECNFNEKVEQLYQERDIYQALRSIDQEGGLVAVDYETTCLKPEYPKGRIVSCAVSNGQRTISYPWWGKAIVATGMLLKSHRTQKIASNLKMEERWTLKEFGHGVSNWEWDTMLASHCLDNRPGICSLKFQALVKMGIPSYNEQVEPYLVSHNGPYNRIEEVEMPRLLLYGGIDSLLEYRLAMLQRKEMGYES